MKMLLTALTILTIGTNCENIAQFYHIFFIKETKNLLINDENDYQKKKSIINQQADYADWDKLNYDKISNLKSKLQSSMYCQRYAINKTNDVILKMYLDMNKIFNKNKPAGILFLVGPPGVGKSFLPKALAKNIFGKNDYQKYFYNFDMADYNTLTSNNTFIEDLTKIDQTKINILLFDEIEKVNNSVWDKFLQILEDGKLNTNQSNVIDFSKSLIIFTSNIGTTVIDDKKNDEQIRSDFKKQVKHYFNNELNKPELLSRIGLNNIIPFDFIKDEEVQRKIISDNIEKIKKNIKENYNLQFEIDLKQVFPLIKGDIDIRLGMRGIFDSIEKNLVDSLTTFLFENKNDIDHFYKTGGWKISCYLQNNKINYRFLAVDNNYLSVRDII